MYKNFTCLLLLLLPLYAVDLPRQGATDPISKLVGGDERAWVYDRFESYMGDKNKCRRGELWTFRRGGTAVIKKCEEGKVSVREVRWSVKRVSDLDTVLKVEGAEYLLLFAPAKPRASRQKMILRQKAEVKTAETKDLIFYHEID